jgi:hypothetical protein
MARPLQDEADPMREYDDDNIRLYAPVLQRVIILAAVVIAVPVMMWTITTFIRSYVARPKAPTFQHLALTEATTPTPASPLAASPPPQAAPPAPQSSAPPAAQPTSAPLIGNTDTTAGGIGRPPLANTGSAAAAPPTGASPSPPPVPAMAAAAVVNPAQGAAPTPQAPTGSPNAPALPTVAQPAGMAARLVTNGSGTPAAAPTDRSTDRSVAWAPPSAGGPPSAGNQEPPVAMTETAATEALPPPQPIKGRVPLPRRRPAALALAATGDMAPAAAVTDTAVNETASTDALPPPQPIKGRVPLPRRRPAVLAFAATTGSIVPSTPTGRGVPMPKMRPAETPPDPPPALTSAPYGYQPGLDGR